MGTGVPIIIRLLESASNPTASQGALGVAHAAAEDPDVLIRILCHRYHQRPVVLGSVDIGNEALYHREDGMDSPSTCCFTMRKGGGGGGGWGGH